MNDVSMMGASTMNETAADMMVTKYYINRRVADKTI